MVKKIFFCICLFITFGSSAQEATIPDSINFSYNFPRMRLMIMGGKSNLLTKSATDDPTISNHFEGLKKNAWHYGASFSYFLSEHFGFDVRYEHLFSSEKTDSLQGNIIEQEPYKGTLDQKLYMNFFSVGIRARKFSENHKFLGQAFAGFGPLYYRSEIRFDNDYVLTGSSLAGTFGLGVDYLTTNGFSFGLETSVTLGSISRLDLNNGIRIKEVELESNESISHVNLSLVIGYNGN